MQAQRESAANTASTAKASGNTAASEPSPQAGDATAHAGPEGMAAQDTLSLRYVHDPTPLLCVYVYHHDYVSAQSHSCSHTS